MSRRTSAPRLRRTWPQRFLIFFNVACILAALVGAGSIAYAKRKVNEIPRVEVGAPGFAGSAHLGDKPRNFLIVGADSDSGLDPNAPERAGRDATVAGVRSDTIMVVRIDPKTKVAKVLSFPRDLWVDIPRHSPSRINASLQFGGSDLLIETIKANFDIDINHYVQVDFAGFKSLVKTIGGVPIWFDTPVGDVSYADHASSGLHITNPGCTTLDETGALQYVRSRHLYRVINGRKVFDGTSDLGRISRQQDFIKRVLRRAISQGARNPVKLASFVNTGVENITLDQGTTANDLIALGRAFRNFDPNKLQTYSLPVSDTYKGGAAVLDLKVGEAEPLLAMFRGTGDPVGPGGIAPATVAVKVLNGSGKQNQASDASAVLAQVGFKMSPPSSSTSVPQTEVRYAPGNQAQAVLVARHLYANPVLIEDRDVQQITVITGPDFGAAIVDARPETDISVPTTTTTTTAPTSGTSGPTTSGTSTTTTTTTPVTGYVPGPPPAGESCG